MSAHEDESKLAAMGPSQAVLAASVAHRFHVEGRSKIQIAEEFGVSRFKVARLLESARAQGLVRIEISGPGPLDVGLSDELRSAYGLRSALVLAEDGTSARSGDLELRDRLGTAAADLLTEIVRPHDVLGLAWGRTVNVMTEALHRLPKCSVVQLCGVYSRMNMRDSSVDTVRKVAAISGGAAYPIYAPLVMPDRRTADTLRRQPGISESFEQFDSVTKAVVAIGAWQPGQSTVYDVLDERERKALAATGVAAELSAHLFDVDGRVLATGLSHHVLAIGTDQLRRIPEVIALAGGRAKAAAIDAVLRSGVVTTVITDIDAAGLLLASANRNPLSHRALERTAP
ncbi:MAG: sugar-binding transcriptional regulator [Sciscionella sp.]